MPARDPAALRFRHGDDRDVAVLADLGARAFVAAFGPRNEPDDIRAYVAEAFDRQRIAQELRAPGSVFLLAEDDAEVVAYARLAQGPAPAGVDGTHPIELVRIYVEPAQTGRGYGAQLLAECLEQARRMGGDALWLGVWEHNHGAQRFYRRWGFERVGEQPFVLGSDLQTDHVMARTLDG